jgi:transcription elongation GreA/GreB family factor
MSSAFVKEDIDEPERSSGRRSASGLPPGALNYITETGAQRLREKLAELKQDGADAMEIAELESQLESVTVVEPPKGAEAVVFGVTATLQNDKGEEKVCRIAGVDEVHFDPCGISWISDTGKALLGATVGQRITLDAEGVSRWTVIKIE